PSPTIPSFMRSSPSRRLWTPRCAYRQDPSTDLGSSGEQRVEGDPGGADATGLEGAEVAGRLGLLQVAEAEVPPGDRDLLLVRRGHLDAHDGVGPALVELPGGVQEAGAEAERDRHPVLVPEAGAHGLELGGDRALGVDERL